VRAGRREPDIGYERVRVGRGHQRQGGVHDDRAQDGLKLGPAQVLPLHQHAADVAVRPVQVGDQVRCGGGRPERARQARAEVRDPRRPGERDLPLVQVDRAGWIPLDLQDAGDPPFGQPLEGRGDPRSGQRIGSGQLRSHPRPGRVSREHHK